MLVTLDDAALSLCTPAGHLLRLMSGHLFRRSGDQRIVCDFFKAAEIVMCPAEIAKAVAKGDEWLLQSHEVERLYGCNEPERIRVAKAPAFTPNPYPAVWRTTPFLKWLELTPKNRQRVLEGKKPNVRIKK